jgi:hypothetical protein
MALDDTEVLIPATGYVFLNATLGAAAPALTPSATAALDLTAATLATGWTNMGHTSRDDNVSLGRDGGDVTTVGTWQASALRTSVAPITYTLTLNALQANNETFQLYFGGGSIAGTDYYDMPDNATAQDRALYVVFVDGTKRLPLWVPKASIIGSDAVEADPEDFLQFNLSATFVKHATDPIGRWFAANLGAAS